MANSYATLSSPRLPIRSPGLQAYSLQLLSRVLLPGRVSVDSVVSGVELELANGFTCSVNLIHRYVLVILGAGFIQANVLAQGIVGNFTFG